jgi:hypothetical protein
MRKKVMTQRTEQVFNQFSMHHIIIMLGDFNANEGGKEFYHLTTDSDCGHKNSNYNGVTALNVTT